MVREVKRAAAEVATVRKYWRRLSDNDPFNVWYAVPAGRAAPPGIVELNVWPFRTGRDLAAIAPEESLTTTGWSSRPSARAH